MSEQHEDNSQAAQELSDQPVKPDGGLPQTPSAGGMASLTDSIGRLRSAIKLQLLVSRVGVIAAAYIGAMVLGGVVDYLLRFPGALRSIAWLGAAGLLVFLIWKVLLPIIRFKPSDTDLALRLENTPVGKERGWQGLLASGLELSKNNTLAGDERLAKAATELAGERFSSARVQVLRLLDPSDLRRSLLFGALAAATILGLSVAAPEYLRIGTRRVLLPWVETQWPKRTGVMLANRPIAHPLGTALPLRAILTKSSRSVEKTRVEATYRLMIDKKEVATQRALLTPQGKKGATDAVLGEQPTEGDLFERLIDVQALLPSDRAAWADKDVSLEYWFATRDDETEHWKVAIVEPPAVESMRVIVTPPAYLAQVGDALAGVVRGDIDAGNGLDGRADVGPILAGSRVRIEMNLNKPLPTPGTADSEWVARTLPGFTELPILGMTLGDQQWAFDLVPQSSIRTSIVPKDMFGIGAREESSLRLEVIEDRPPTAAIIDPPQDESVLATAQIPVVAEGRDDVAVWRTGLWQQIAKVPGDSVGAPAAATGEPSELKKTSRDDESAATPSDVATEEKQDIRTLRVTQTVDLSSLALSPGDEVWLNGRVADARGAFGAENQAEASVSSPTRRLKIISESQLVEQVRAELNGLRDAARRLEQDQRTLGEQRPAATEGANIENAQQAAQTQADKQQSISERLQPLRDSLQRLAKRSERNAISDTALRGMLNDANEAADAAQQETGKASQALKQLSTERDAGARNQASQATQQSQDQAQQELANLSDMLGQNDDNWTVRRQLEQLLSDQRQLRNQTAAAGNETAGQDMDELSQKQKDDLDRLARRQAELSQRAAQVLDQAQERAAQLEENKSAQGQAMREAVQRARARQLAQRQQQASNQIRQNQTGGAQQSQQDAEKALEEALDAMDDVQKAKDEQLRRVLADIMQSLEQLIARQEGEIAKLSEAIAGNPAKDLDKTMVTLQQNTLGVLDKIRKEAEDATKLASLVEAATESQAGAIVALRAEPADFPSADQQERASLQKLKEAVDEAKKMDGDAQKRDDDRVRRELRKLYAEALELETQMRGDAAKLLGVEATRRTRIQARAIGEEQEKLRQRVDELRSKTQDLKEAKVFDYAHTRLDRAMSDAATVLRAGEVTKLSLIHI